MATINVLKDKSGNILNPKIPRYEKIKTKKLWSNSDPTKVLNANVYIKLSDTNYDAIIWIYCFNNTASNIELSTICEKGKSVLLNAIGYGGGGTARRILDYQNDSQYKTQIGKEVTAGDTNTVCIPICAIGIYF